MTGRKIAASVGVAVLLAVIGGVALAAEDKFALTAPSGIAFADFRGYESWETVAVSETEDRLKVILANPVMINAYKQGIPDNGKSFPDGSKIAKIQWSKRKSAVAPAPTTEVDTLREVEFIQKDSKRYPTTSGWGYAFFEHDHASDTFKPGDAAFSQTCHGCHTIVIGKDYVFTSYARR